MRLLNVHTFRLESFMGDEFDIPAYAILSHTWEGTEIIFDDIQCQPYGVLRDVPAFKKVEQSCLRARMDNFNYIWIDTCCIDKTSSAELSEAINSMFKYYMQSSKCYVYLSDFKAIPAFHPASGSIPGMDVHITHDDFSFATCRWFGRGWTLQELIAPRIVEFFDRDWSRFGTRDGDLLDRVCRCTNIWPHVFREPRCVCGRSSSLEVVRKGFCMNCKNPDTLPQTLDTFAVSMKMHWAAKRVTTRTEDAAYCLLGLFSINMPLLYGEGQKAFLRLQEAIVRQAKDQSILLWRAVRTEFRLSSALGCLAPSSQYFSDLVPIIGRRVFNNVDKRFEADFLGRMAPMEVTDTALRTNLWLCPCTVAAFDPDEDTFVDQKLWLGILDLAHDDDYLTRPAILLEHMGIVDLYRRVYNQLIVPLNPRIKYSTMNISLSTSSLGEVQALADHSTITVTRTLDEAFQKDVGILLQQSPINAVKTQPNQERRPVTGPVYVVMTPDAKVPSITDSGGSHPLFSSYQSRSSQISAPWTFEKCKHWGVERFLGGIHFLDLTFDKGDTTKHRADIVVVWGMHEDFRKVDEELAKDPTATPWKPWCRVFDMVAFMKSAKTSPDDLRPTQLYRRIEAMSPGQIQEKIENQRRRLCLHGYETFWIQQESGPKRLFPDSCEDEWVEDRLSHIMDDTQHMVDVTAKVSRTEGLGRTIFELQVKVEATERAGWRASDEPQRKKKAGAFPANDEIIDPFRHSNRHRRP